MGYLWNAMMSLQQNCKTSGFLVRSTIVYFTCPAIMTQSTSRRELRGRERERERRGGGRDLPDHSSLAITLYHRYRLIMLLAHNPLAGSTYKMSQGKISHIVQVFTIFKLNSCSNLSITQWLVVLSSVKVIDCLILVAVIIIMCRLRREGCQ